jgi:hypothetical protein
LRGDRRNERLGDDTDLILNCRIGVEVVMFQ